MSDFFTKNSIKGVIFDCDGVLVDSEVLSCNALNVIFEKHFKIDIGNDYSPVIGKSVIDGINYYISKHKISVPASLDITKLGEEKDETFMSLARDTLKSFPGVIILLEYLQTEKISKCVASSGSLEKITFNLQETKLLKYFEIISSSQEVIKGKPNPDLFLLSAKKMNLRPEECVVIEDSVMGIKGAKAAHMMAVGVTTSFKKDDLLLAGADVIITRVDDLLTI